MEAEIAGVVMTRPRGVNVRPKLVYALNDRWTLTAGADWFRGSALSVFGLQQQNSGVFTEVRWSF